MQNRVSFTDARAYGFPQFFLLLYDFAWIYKELFPVNDILVDMEVHFGVLNHLWGFIRSVVNTVASNRVSNFVNLLLCVGVGNFFVHFGCVAVDDHYNRSRYLWCEIPFLDYYRPVLVEVWFDVLLYLEDVGDVVRLKLQLEVECVRCRLYVTNPSVSRPTENFSRIGRLRPVG